MLRCPKDPAHRTFTATAVVAETWLVDEKGEYLDVLPEPTVMKRPSVHNDDFTCAECEEEVFAVKAEEPLTDYQCGICGRTYLGEDGFTAAELARARERKFCCDYCAEDNQEHT